MRIFLDTSVIIAAQYTNYHLHYESSQRLLDHCKDHQVFCAAHTLLEAHASMTGMPGPNRFTVEEAGAVIGYIRRIFSLVTLDGPDYVEILARCARLNLAGGIIYDMAIAYCALKANADAIYTWNVKHFRRLGPDIEARLRTPGELP